MNEKLLIEYRALLQELFSKRYKQYTDLEKGELNRKIKIIENNILDKMK